MEEEEEVVVVEVQSVHHHEEDIVSVVVRVVHVQVTKHDEVEHVHVEELVAIEVEVAHVPFKELDKVEAGHIHIEELVAVDVKVVHDQVEEDNEVPKAGQLVTSSPSSQGVSSVVVVEEEDSPSLLRLLFLRCVAASSQVCVGAGWSGTPSWSSSCIEDELTDAIVEAVHCARASFGGRGMLVTSGRGLRARRRRRLASP